ncbi:hypothetical protein C9374_004167 [Naegleria lovaniensis]|uniref:Uncharacterized protein n=1 Tax=Naegleria lovaniensis TaxID=51637 RepID=A0AA88KPA4_NAELO|nr:uncharacterized protein C9374_004167 [Naegleria lovaniensis]KAG2383496.1 hypothetical protein C9374_004167 [Naegleria lovaniensis]
MSYIHPPEPPPYSNANVSAANGFYNPSSAPTPYGVNPMMNNNFGRAKLHSPDVVQELVMGFVREQQDRQAEEEKPVTANPMEILYTFMSYFNSWKLQNTTSSTPTAAHSSDGSKADKVDLLSDEDVLNCFVIIMHCIVRDRYTDPSLFSSYIKQSIDSIVQISRLQSVRF